MLYITVEHGSHVFVFSLAKGEEIALLFKDAARRQSKLKVIPHGREESFL